MKKNSRLQNSNSTVARTGLPPLPEPGNPQVAGTSLQRRQTDGTVPQQWLTFLLPGLFQTQNTAFTDGATDEARDDASEIGEWLGSWHD